MSDEATVEELQAKLEEMQAALTKANGEAADRRKTASELKKKLEMFDGIDVDKYKESIEAAQKAEQERLKQEGQFEEALEKGLASAKAEIETLKGLIAGKDSKLSNVLIDNAILSAIDGKAVNNDQVLALLRGNIKLEGDNPIVMDGDKPKLDDKGNHITPGAYAVEFLASNPHLAKAGGGGSGSGGGRDDNNADAKVIKRADYEKMTPVARSEHFKAGGKVED